MAVHAVNRLFVPEWLLSLAFDRLCHGDQQTVLQPSMPAQNKENILKTERCMEPGDRLVLVPCVLSPAEPAMSPYQPQIGLIPESMSKSLLVLMHVCKTATLPGFPRASMTRIHSGSSQSIFFTRSRILYLTSTVPSGSRTPPLQQHKLNIIFLHHDVLPTPSTCFLCQHTSPSCPGWWSNPTQPTRHLEAHRLVGCKWLPVVGIDEGRQQ